MIQTHEAQERLRATHELLRDTGPQTERLLATILLEQPDAEKRLLQSIQIQEGLQNIAIVEQVQLPQGCFNFTRYEAVDVAQCYADNLIHVVIALQYADRHCGFLVKSRSHNQTVTRLWSASALARILVLWLVIMVIGLFSINVFYRRRVVIPLQCLLGAVANSASSDLAVGVNSNPPTEELRSLENSINQLITAVRKNREENQLRAVDSATAKLAQQMAHDIRSPLTALRAMVGQVAGVSEESRVMMRNAVQRIEDIANDLCAKREHERAGEAGGADVCSEQLLSSLLEPLISEKRTQHRAKLGVEIHAALDGASYGVFAVVQPVEFKRVISNLINNAVEAMDQGLVTVAVRQEDESVVLTVTDTGRGIPPDVLPKLMNHGASFGKNGGSGLGLYHARTMFERWGGTVTLTSTVGVGTTVTLTLPRAVAPAWFVPELVLTPGSTIVIVDDDVSIHQIWQERLEGDAQEITLQHFSSGTEVVTWYQGQANTHFLCDYEFLGHPNNGLELIAQLNVADRAILVTSHYEETPIQARCAEMGVRLIPKGLAGFVPVRVEPVAESIATTISAHIATAPSPQLSNSETAKPTALVLDDDEGIRFVWPMEGRRLGLATITTFASMEACEATQPDYTKFDFAFVDKHIPESTWRVDQVITHLKAQGVKKVFVASGESARELMSDPLCAAADGIIPMKIPQKLPT
ncbi:MAG: hybrid sensor histidine kinase/response regulator [Deltaproteobacteria bacterium]|nr:hybrid sensor histidine kinase/response regulator [Deltaproteobacteria bacterium]